MNESPGSNENMVQPHYQARWWAEYVLKVCVQFWGLGGCGLFLPAPERRILSTSSLSIPAWEQRARQWFNLHLELLTWLLLSLWHKKQWRKPWLCCWLLTASCLFPPSTRTKGNIWQKEVWWESLSCDSCSDKMRAVKTLYPQRKVINYVVLWFLFAEQYFRPWVSPEKQRSMVPNLWRLPGDRTLKVVNWPLLQWSLLVSHRNFRRKKEQVNKSGSFRQVSLHMSY